MAEARALYEHVAGSDDPVYVRALANLGRVLSFSGAAEPRSRAAREVGDRALHLARRIGDDELVCHALRGQLWRRVTLERAPALLAPARELMELATRSGDLELVVPAAFFRSLFGFMRGLPVEWLIGHNDLVRACRCGG